MNSEKRRTVFFRAFWRIVILLFVMIPLLWGVRTSLCASYLYSGWFDSTEGS